MAGNIRYRRPEDLPERIPVFPLRGCILLPRSSLPLNVFEPRYLQMVDDVLRGDRVIGIVQPDLLTIPMSQESPPGKETPLARVGCAARLIAYQELDDGRLIISLAGIARFIAEDEIRTDRPYRTLAVRYEPYAADFTSPEGDAGVDREELQRVLKTYLEARSIGANWQAITSAPLEQLVNALAVASPYDPIEKQALLEAPSLKARAELLIALAERELSQGRGGAGPVLQ